MRNYNRSTSGRWVRTVKNGNSIVVTDGFSVKETTILSATSNRGNFVDPLPQGITRSQLSLMEGTYRAGFTTSSNYSLIEGLLGYNSDPGGQSLSFSSEVYNRALEKLYTELRGEVDLSVDLLQAGQVRSMMSQGVSALAHLGRTVRRMRREPTRVAAELWLTYVYGVKPLMGSIYGTLETFKNGARKGLIRVQTRAREGSSRTVSWNNVGDANLPARTTETTSKRCLIQCDFGIKDSTLNNLASLSSLNPVSIIWETIPYSFVIDWFADIGGYVRNLESAFLYSASFKRGFATEGYLIEGTTTTNGSYQASGLDRFINARGSYRLSGKRRAVFSSSPLPRLPRFHVDLGASRLLSAASLLRVQLGR